MTDRIALQAMAKYNWDELVWKNSAGDKDVYKNDDLNLYGLGIQGRIVDTNEWISTLSGYYEHQKHGVDYFIADLNCFSSKRSLGMHSANWSPFILP